jgi:hypothetical protein
MDIISIACSVLKIKNRKPFPGRDSSVGTATRYELDSPVVRIPVGTKFSTPIQTGPAPPSAYYTMDTGSFPEVKQAGRGVDHSFPSSSKVKERLELIFLGLRGLFQGELYLTFAKHFQSLRFN